jgi:dTDP-4-amino-4,6-dideoxygalactose transaminase
MPKLALLGGSQSKNKSFPPWPQYDETERQALLAVLESRMWWRTPGTQTLAFEQEFAAFQDAKYAIAVTNGTAALEIAMATLGIGTGDEVIVPDFTFVATASAVLSVGALPVLVDVTPDTYCVDPVLVEQAITPRTKAVIAVHMGGHPADLDALSEICQQYHLRFVEDSAHAHGSEWKGRKVGAIGDIGTFSFQSSKLITAGEGGMVITNDPELARLARSIHDCGRLPDEWFYAHFHYGSNYRLSEWQGAVLRAQLARMPNQATLRRKNAAWLDRELAKIPGITPQREDPRCSFNGHYAYIFHYDPHYFSEVPPERLIQALNAEGVPTQASYPPLHAMDVFQSGAYRSKLSGHQRDEEHSFLSAEFPNTLRGAWETVWLPQSVLLGDEQDMTEVVFAIEKIQAESSELATIMPESKFRVAFR